MIVRIKRISSVRTRLYPASGTRATLITFNRLQALIPDLICVVAQGGSPTGKTSQSGATFLQWPNLNGWASIALARVSLFNNAVRLDSGRPEDDPGPRAPA
jgi:hypothetical protein